MYENKKINKKWKQVMDRGEGCLFWKNAWSTYNTGRVCIGENLVQKVDVQYVMYAFILIYSYVFFTYFHKRKYSALLHQLAGGIVYSSVCFVLRLQRDS